MRYVVQTFKDAGLEARWGRTGSGAPMIFARNPKARLKHQRESWWAMDARFWKEAETVGVAQAFDQHTLLGDMFSVPA